MLVGTSLAKFLLYVLSVLRQQENTHIVFYKNSMKHTVTALLAASFCAFGMMAVAEKVTPSDSREYGETMSHLILREQCILSGLVLETKRGIAITTNRGTFLLKGVEIDTLVGKNVRVTGVIRDESIFAVKIDS